MDLDTAKSPYAAILTLGLVLSSIISPKLWRFCVIFRGLQGSQTKRVLSKFFLRHRPPFDRVLGVIAPHSTGP